MQWSEFLSRLNFVIGYRSGKETAQPDALSRREQNMPQGEDARFTLRQATLLDPGIMEGFPSDVIPLQTAALGPLTEADAQHAPNPSVPQLWSLAQAKDTRLQLLKECVKRGDRRFPPDAAMRVQISDCALDNDKGLTWRGRKWVPDDEPLRTGLIQYSHDSVLAGHPERDATYAIVARQFYWPGLADDIR